MQYILTEEDIESIALEMVSIRLKRMASWQSTEDAKQKRVDKGLKTNRITTSELRMIMEDWLANDRKNLSESFLNIYQLADKTHKEYDWVERRVGNTYYAKELTKAFNDSNHPDILT